MSRKQHRTTIAISRKNRDALRTYGRAGDTSNDVLTILLNMANKDRVDTVITRPLREKNSEAEIVKNVGRSL